MPSDGDLISRSELKKAIKSYADDQYAENEYLGEYAIMTIIDNAPTVAYPFEKFRTLFCGTCQAYMRIEPERPQGEWIAREDMDYLDENKVVHKHFECNKCGLIHDFIDGHTSQYNFCPECGARMQTKENLNG